MKTPCAVVAFWVLLTCVCCASPPARAALPVPAGDKVPKDAQAILDEIGVPPLPASPEVDNPRFQAFTPDQADKYAAGGDDSDLRKAVRKARVLLWAVSDAPAPKNLADDVAALRKHLTVKLPGVTDAYHQPADENKFRDQVYADERAVASLMAEVNDGLDGLKAAGEKRDLETKRWQANYDMTVARLEGEIVFLFEYQSMLGQMRKELPPLAAGQNGWKLVAQATIQGDPEGKKLARESWKILDKVIADNPGTPWEVLARLFKSAPLGLEWKSVTIK